MSIQIDVTSNEFGFEWINPLFGQIIANCEVMTIVYFLKRLSLGFKNNHNNCVYDSILMGVKFILIFLDIEKWLAISDNVLIDILNAKHVFKLWKKFFMSINQSLLAVNNIYNWIAYIQFHTHISILIQRSEVVLFFLLS